MLSREAAKRLVPKANLNINVIYPYPFSTDNIIDVVKYTDKEATKYDYSELAQRFKSANDLVTLKNIYDFAKNNILYVGDKPRKEYVKLPHSLIHIGEGDCKSFSVLIVSLLRTLGYNCFYRFVQYNSRDFEHVYVICQIRDQQGLKNIVMDAVPGGGFITELSYTKKFDMEPEGVAMISGNRNEYNLPFFDYHQTTDGEFGLQLQVEYAKMMLHHGNGNATYLRNGITAMENALYSGIHGRNPKITGSSDFRAAIERAKLLSHPAAGNLVVLQNRKSIGDALIPLESYTKCDNNKNASPSGYWDTLQNKFVDGSYSSGSAAAYDKCSDKIRRDNDMKTGLNDHLVKFAARYLYHFDDGVSLFDNSGVRFETKTKISEHRRLFEDMVDVSKLGYGNMEMWSKLAIGKQTSDRGHGVLTPEYGIQLFKENPEMGLYDENGNPHIGEPITLTIAICYAILIAVSGSVAAAFVQVCKNKEPTALGYVEKIIGSGWGAKGKDWQKSDAKTTDTKTTDTKTTTTQTTNSNTASFWTKNKKAILIGTGVTAAAGAGLLIHHSNSNS